MTPRSDVTNATSMASRASTVRRLRRIIRDSVFRGARMDPDMDNVKDLRMKLLDINTVKYTLIMLSVTIVFILSFLPYLALTVWRFYKDEHESNILSDTDLVLFQIGIRSIFLNNSLNPVIYGGFNSQFRAFFYRVFCCCCFAKKAKRKKTRDQSDSTSAS